MSETPNHDYNTPEAGTMDWHDDLNENFEALDAGVEIRDNSNNMDEYEPKEGAKFFATDTGEVYLGDGEDWASSPISSSSYAFPDGPRQMRYRDTGDNDWQWELSQWNILGFWEVDFAVQPGGNTLVNGYLTFGDATVQRTAGPIAKGHVEEDGTLTNGVNVEEVSWNDTPNWYNITVDGVESSIEEYVVTATPTQDAIAVSTGVTGGDPFRVQFADDDQHEFTFVIHSLVEP